MTTFVPHEAKTEP